MEFTLILLSCAIIEMVPKFRADLLAGDYFPENAEIKRLVLAGQRRDYDERMENHHYEVLQKILESRKGLLEAATGTVITAPKLERKRGRGGANMRTKIKKRYKEELSRIKKEVGEEGLSSDEEQETAVPPPPPALLHLSELESERAGAGEPPLTQDIQPCFLSLLRDLFLQSDCGLSPAQLDAALVLWQDSPIAALNPW